MASSKKTVSQCHSITEKTISPQSDRHVFPSEFSFSLTESSFFIAEPSLVIAESSFDDFRYMKIHIFALRWRDDINRSSQLRTLLKLVVVNRT